MSRVIMQAPAGDEYYPVRVERSYFKRGDAIVAGDPLYDLATANGRQLRIRATHSGLALSSPYEAGDHLGAPESLIEIELGFHERARPAPQPAGIPAVPAWDDDVDDEVWDATPRQTRKRDPRKILLWLGGGVIAFVLFGVVGWFALSYMPLGSDSGDTDGYYGARTGLEPLGGKRRLFISDEQQERFELWLDT
ncbi:hypothetical protein [Martelella soudanensis]|uniref:hypothetical protein n=1 Tax=unclassified Martelella TaxID=2629616 RepID=UPI0015DE7E71|nr:MULTISPECIES: hypothetical protein [unclassified Martelella]